jgi:adenylate cyclase
MSEGGVQNRLSAILAADVASYTRLVEKDNEGTVAAWRAARTDIINPTVASHLGRIVKLTGDGFLAEFNTVQSAVECAIALQEQLASSTLDFRMGIGLGDIIDDGEDIHGEGVNIAARIEALADAGGISVSGMVYEAVRNQMDANFEDTGEQTVKNVSNPVRVYKILTGAAMAAPDFPITKSPRIPRRLLAAIAGLLILLAGGTLWWQTRPDFEPVEPSTMALKLPDKPSIAVLPFDYFGEGKTENEYIADGLSEQITAVLADVPELFVIARNSSFTYKGKAVDVREVSKKFGVRYLLEGSVQKSGDKLRVIAQLIDAVDGKHIWAETFDRAYTDLFKIQDEITVAVAQKIHLGSIRGNELANRPTVNLEAWSENVKGLEQLRLFTAEGYENARQRFARAIELDPQYVNPHHLMAFAYVNDVRFGYSADPAKSFSLAEQFLSKALALESGNVEALAGTAFLRYVQKKIPEAKRLALEAHESAPNQPNVAFALAWILLYSGDPEGAIPYYSLIKRLAPVTSIAILNGDLLAHIYAGKYEEARKLVPAYLERVPEALQPVNLVLSALPYYNLNDVEKAKSMVAKALQLQPNLSIKSFRHYDLPFVDQSVPESFYAIYRKLGVPDLPPSQRADPEKKASTLLEKPSIAVLPFANMSDDKSQEYFADGMADDLITDLSHVSGLLVIARNSSFSYKGRNVKVQEIAADLGVRYVLEGSVRRAGGQIRINAQLIDTSSGSHLWANTFDRPFKNVFALQDEVTAKIVAALKVKLTPGETAQLGVRDTASLEAYEAYLQGWSLAQQLTPEAYAKALPLLTKSVILDPNYSVAHAALAFLFWEGGVQRGWHAALATKNRQDAYQKTEYHLDKASGTSTPITSIVRAEILSLNEYDNDAAVNEARRAVKLAPNFADAYFALALQLSWAELPIEALAMSEMGKRLDPKQTGMYHKTVGIAHYVANRYDRALQAYEKATEINPSDIWGWILLTAIQGHLGNELEASEAKKQLDLNHTPLTKSKFQAGYAYTVPFKDHEVKKRLFEDLKAAGVPAGSAETSEGDIDRQLSQAEIKTMLVNKPIEGVMAATGVDYDGETFTYFVSTDLTGVFRTMGMKFLTRNRFEGDSICNERGCTEFFKLTATAAKRWNATHVFKEATGILYYFRPAKNFQVE